MVYYSNINKMCDLCKHVMEIVKLRLLSLLCNANKFCKIYKFFNAEFSTARDNEQLKEATLNANHLQKLNNLSQTIANDSACMNFTNDPLLYVE